jgi:hypothetical protein
MWRQTLAGRRSGLPPGLLPFVVARVADGIAGNTFRRLTSMMRMRCDILVRARFDCD